MFGFEVPNGLLACDEFVNCADSCDTGDDACIDDCTDATSAGGFGDYNNLTSCASDAGCYDLDDPDVRSQCFETNCSDEILACFGAPPEPNGAGDCIELTSCLNSCEEDDSACVVICVELSSQTGYDDLLSLQSCVANSVDANGFSL